jgi:hypothetical protein
MDELFVNAKFLVDMVGFWGIFAGLAMISTVAAVSYLVEGIKKKNRRWVYVGLVFCVLPAVALIRLNDIHPSFFQIILRYLGFRLGLN